jgi:hypothetical protein
MTFFTERQTEEFLTPETRTLTLPDGTSRPLTVMKIFWHSYDFLLTWELYTPEQLMRFTLGNAAAKGYSFEESFQATMSYCHNNACKRMGFD